MFRNMSKLDSPSYAGRFAPSPTGPLHFGSLIAALASYLDARHRHGRWLVRIEDVDTTRCKAQWASDILRTLEAFGLHWDGAIIYQSHETARYEEAIAKLRAAGMLYACTCSRREIGDSGIAGIDGPVYPGACRNLDHAEEDAALRVRTRDATVRFTDRVQGGISQRIASGVGDFVVRRRDGLHAYQLAVVVDDALQGVTDIVRGADLLDSTPRQIYLQHLLGLATPRYLHFPVAVDAAGQKLSKLSLAPDVYSAGARSALLLAALRHLGQDVAGVVETRSIPALLTAAAENWQPALIPRLRSIVAEGVSSA